MDIKEVMDFIKWESERLKKNFQTDDKERLLARTVKIGEEYGELCDDILAFRNLQRRQKMGQRKIEDLHEEVIDVILVTLLLAEELGIDVESEIRKKIEKVREREY